MRVGIVGLESYGLRERSVALDILHGITERCGHEVAYHLDAAFDPLDHIWSRLELEAVDLIAISLRAGSGSLLPRLAVALKAGGRRYRSPPKVVFGGTTALASPDNIKALFPEAIICTTDAETVFPTLLDQRAVQGKSTYSGANFLGQPAHYSTRRAAAAGGTIWIEASRGCRSHCSFCVLSNRNVARGWAPRAVDELFDELEVIIHDYGVSDFSFSDFSGFEDDLWLRSFVAEREKRGLEFTFRCDMRLGAAKSLRAQLPALYAAGLRQVFTGVESLVNRQQRIYGKGYPGNAIIRELQQHGIGVVVGLIILDPMMTPADFRHNVLGIKREGLLELIGTPHKLMRVQRGTAYADLLKEQGLRGRLNSDLYTYQYRCADPGLEFVRQAIEFFHNSTKTVYYNNYIENMLCQSGRGVKPGHLSLLSQITNRFKAAEYRFIDAVSGRLVEDGLTLQEQREIVLSESFGFCQSRRELFAQTADDYRQLIEEGIQGYRDDLRAFIDHHPNVATFDPCMLSA